MTEFKEKLSIFQDKSPVICCEIFSQSAGSEHKLEIGTSNSSSKEGKLYCGDNEDNNSRRIQALYAIQYSQQLQCQGQRLEKAKPSARYCIIHAENVPKQSCWPDHNRSDLSRASGPSFDPRLVHEGFVVNKVAFWRFFLSTSVFFVSSIPLTRHAHI